MGEGFSFEHLTTPNLIAQVEPIEVIDVYGKSADMVAKLIINALGDAPQKGCIMILQGLSGTGKVSSPDVAPEPHTLC